MFAPIQAPLANHWGYRKLLFLERYGMIVLIVLVLVLHRVCNVSPVAAASEAVYGFFFRIAVFANSLTI